jgi:methyltransferase (TIGR00027 family)
MAVTNVSDTARWVALYRAMETDRPDALFNDPYARKLAGAEGQEIVNTLKHGRTMAWAMITRTVVFDEVILSEINDRSVDLIVNLAAGLDARPWRLDLPPSLQWVDVDLPGILQYKTDTLADVPPKCRYEAIHADLTDPHVRQALFERLGARSSNALVVTEGLLVYLTPEEVGAMATALAAVPAFRHWLIDLASPMLLQWVERMWSKSLSNAPFRFGPAEGTAFFEKYGWREERFFSTGEEARRLRREMPLAWLWRLMARLYPKEKQQAFKRFSGYVVLARSSGTASLATTGSRSNPPGDRRRGRTG